MAIHTAICGVCDEVGMRLRCFRLDIEFCTLRLVLPALVGALAIFGGLARADARISPPLDGVHRILFLGDSITYSGEFVDIVDECLAERLPERRFTVIDLGLPSETVSGLTEPNHAGGAFPRPDVHERLDRAISQTKPDLVVACYGMNDGIYYPFSEERFARYRQGIQDLADRVSAAHARLLLLTPPPFDPDPVRATLLPAGRDAYPSGQTYEGYDDVLSRYAGWLAAQRTRGWHVVDIHTPIDTYLAFRRKTEPAFRLAGDGVHIDALGHWLIAREILEAFKLPPDSAVVDAARHASRSPGISGITRNGTGVAFTWTIHRPFPSAPKGSQMQALVSLFLTVKGLPAGRMRIVANGAPLAVLKAADLAKGIELYPAPPEPEASQLAALIRRRERLLTDSWLTAVGHKRPGMARGLPLAEATAKSEALYQRMRALAAPYEMRIAILPDNEPHPATQ